MPVLNIEERSVRGTIAGFGFPPGDLSRVARDFGPEFNRSPILAVFWTIIALFRVCNY